MLLSQGGGEGGAAEPPPPAGAAGTPRPGLCARLRSFPVSRGRPRGRAPVPTVSLWPLPPPPLGPSSYPRGLPAPHPPVSSIPPGAASPFSPCSAWGVPPALSPPPPRSGLTSSRRSALSILAHPPPSEPADPRPQAWSPLCPKVTPAQLPRVISGGQRLGLQADGRCPWAGRAGASWAEAAGLGQAELPTSGAWGPCPQHPCPPPPGRPPGGPCLGVRRRTEPPAADARPWKEAGVSPQTLSTTARQETLWASRPRGVGQGTSGPPPPRERRPGHVWRSRRDPRRRPVFGQLSPYGCWTPAPWGPHAPLRAPPARQP